MCMLIILPLCEHFVFKHESLVHIVRPFIKKILAPDFASVIIYVTVKISLISM